jgi:hypothetical protein
MNKKVGNLAGNIVFFIISSLLLYICSSDALCNVIFPNNLLFIAKIIKPISRFTMITCGLVTFIDIFFYIVQSDGIFGDILGIVKDLLYPGFIKDIEHPEEKKNILYIPIIKGRKTEYKKLDFTDYKKYGEGDKITEDILKPIKSEIINPICNIFQKLNSEETKAIYESYYPELESIYDGLENWKKVYDKAAKSDFDFGNKEGARRKEAVLLLEPHMSMIQDVISKLNSEIDAYEKRDKLYDQDVENAMNELNRVEEKAEDLDFFKDLKALESVSLSSLMDKYDKEEKKGGKSNVQDNQKSRG